MKLPVPFPGRSPTTKLPVTNPPVLTLLILDEPRRLGLSVTMEQDVPTATEAPLALKKIVCPGTAAAVP